MNAALHATGNVLSVVGPIVWAFYTLRARRNDKAAKRKYADARRMIVRCNAEVLQCQMLRMHRERQASTCNGKVYHGTEAPV